MAAYFHRQGRIRLAQGAGFVPGYLGGLSRSRLLLAAEQPPPVKKKDIPVHDPMALFETARTDVKVVHKEDDR